MEKRLMLTVVAWNDLFWVALRVCKISGISGLSFPRFRHKAEGSHMSVSRHPPACTFGTAQKNSLLKKSSLFL